MESVKIKKPKVYYTKNVTKTTLLRLIEVMGRSLKGDVAIKIDLSNEDILLTPEIVSVFTDFYGGTIVENSVERNGAILSVDGMKNELNSLGFSSIAPVDILDCEGEIKLSVAEFKNLKGENFVGLDAVQYNSMLVLSEFNGEAGNNSFGGAINNLSIGMASKGGKQWINSAGFTKDRDVEIDHNDKIENIIMSKAEAGKSVVDYFTRANLIYMNITDDIAVDGDCGNICEKRNVTGYGIYASVDPVALDQACFDAVSRDSRVKTSATIEQKEKEFDLLLQYAEEMGLGERLYELIEI